MILEVIVNGIFHLNFQLYIVSIFFFINLFIFGCIRSSLLHVGFSLVTASGGLLFIVVRRLLIAVASLVVEHGV